MWKQRIKTNKWNKNASHTVPYLIFWFPKFHGIIQDMWTSESEDMIFIYKSNGRHGPPPICLFHYFSPNPATTPFVEDQSKSRGSLLPLFSVSNFSHHCWPSLKWRRFKTVLNTELNDVVWLLSLTSDLRLLYLTFYLLILIRFIIRFDSIKKIWISVSLQKKSNIINQYLLKIEQITITNILKI